MCIAILNGKRATLKKETLRNCWENNGDGAGILYIDDDGVHTTKELKNFDTFYEKYIDIKRKHGKHNILLHFRISTHGLVNESNCHPFLVDEQLGFIHNGMIYNVENSKIHSDTYMFNKNILQNLKQGFEYNQDIMDMIEDFIGVGSKLVFLNAKDQFFIVNEKAGHWANDCWFSNNSYKTVSRYVDYGGTKRLKSGYGSSFKYGNDFHSSIWGGNDHEKRIGCEECNTILYSVRELENKLCHHCIDEFELTNEDSYETQMFCECCREDKPSTFDANYNVFICKKCRVDLGLEYKLDDDSQENNLGA